MHCLYKNSRHVYQPPVGPQNLIYIAGKFISTVPVCDQTAREMASLKYLLTQMILKHQLLPWKFPVRVTHNAVELLARQLTWRPASVDPCDDLLIRRQLLASRTVQFGQCCVYRRRSLQAAALGKIRRRMNRDRWHWCPSLFVRGVFALGDEDCCHGDQGKKHD